MFVQHYNFTHMPITQLSPTVVHPLRYGWSSFMKVSNRAESAALEVVETVLVSEPVLIPFTTVTLQHFPGLRVNAGTICWIAIAFKSSG